MKRALPGWLKILLGVMLVCEGIYLIAANHFLNTEMAFEVISRKPEKFFIRWERAFTPWPGAVRLEGVRTGGQSKKIQWSATIGRVDAWCRILPLFWRTADVLYCRADRLEYRQRRRVDVFTEYAGVADRMPPIPGFSNPPDPPPEALYPRATPRPPWRVITRRVDVDAIQQLWIDRYRAVGDISATASMDLLVRGPLAFSRIELRVKSGDVIVEERSVFDDLNAEVDAVIDPHVPGEVRGAAFFDHLSGRIDVDMFASNLRFLRPYFRRTDWVRTNGRGPVNASLEIDHGELRPGSTFSTSRETVDIAFLDRRLTGTGGISAEVFEEDGQPTSRLVATIDDFEMSPAAGGDPFAFGRDFELRMIGHGADLANPFEDVELTIDMPEARVPDLGVYNAYLPPGSGVSIESGAGTVRYHFEASDEEASLRGEIEITADEMRTRFGDVVFLGDLQLRTTLRGGNALTREFDISGTRLAMSDLRVVGEDRTAGERWWGRLSFPEARMRIVQPLDMHTEFEIDLKDTEPIVALFDARKDLSRFVKRLLTIENLKGRGGVSTHDAVVTIRDLEITGNRLRLLADLEIKEGRNRGLMYIHYGAFRIGIERAGGKKDLKFIRPLDWFNRKRAAARAARGEAIDEPGPGSIPVD